MHPASPHLNAAASKWRVGEKGTLEVAWRPRGLLLFPRAWLTWLLPMYRMVLEGCGVQSTIVAKNGKGNGLHMVMRGTTLYWLSGVVDSRHDIFFAHAGCELHVPSTCIGVGVYLR